MLTNYERIKNMSLEEMAEELVYLTFFTKDKEGKDTKYHIGLDGKPYKLLQDLFKANSEWLQSESEI